MKKARTMPAFSSRTPKDMWSFAVAWPTAAIVQHLAAQIPWLNNDVRREMKGRLPTAEGIKSELAGKGTAS